MKSLDYAEIYEEMEVYQSANFLLETLLSTLKY